MLPVKPSLRCGVSEWNNNNLQLWAEAQQQRLVSSEIRQECRSLRNETHCKTVWDEKETSRRLTERVWDVSRWRDLLDSCAQKVDEEMDALTLSKELTEQALAATATPLEVSTECMMLREGRRGYELVTDPVQEQLQKEVELIERVQQTLQQHIDEAFQQLCVLQEARHQLTGDLQNKMEALDIDKSCLTLTITSPNISLKTNPTRIPSGSSTPQEWVQLSSHNVVQAEEAMRVSQQMREDMSLSRAQLQNELEAERRATEFALRKRSHHEEQAQDELQWQIRNMEAEIAEMESDIRELDADLQAKTAPLKLAHTRLENRTRRPGMDLCRDEVQHSLVAEVEQLEATVLALQQKLSKAQHSLQNMRLHHGQMLQDLSRKQEALSLEQRSLNTRTRLTSGSSTVGVVVPVVPLMNSCGRGNLQLMAEVWGRVFHFRTAIMRLSQLLLSFYILTFLIGVPTNILAFCTFCCKLRRKPTPIDVLLLNLTISDLLFLAFLPFKMKEAYDDMVWLLPYSLCPLTGFLFYVTIYNSTLLLTAVSVERYLGMAFPFQYAVCRRPRYAVWACVLFWAVSLSNLSFVYILPSSQWSEANPGHNQNVSNPTSPPPTCYLEFTPEELSIVMSVRLELFLMLFCIPFLISCFCYINFIHILSRLPNISRRRRLRCIGLALGTLIVFTVCFGPYNASHVVGFIRQENEEWRSIALLSSTLNACLDPLIFYLSSSVVRSTLNRLFRSVAQKLHILRCGAAPPNPEPKLPKTEKYKEEAPP